MWCVVMVVNGDGWMFYFAENDRRRHLRVPRQVKELVRVQGQEAGLYTVTVEEEGERKGGERE